MRRFVKNGETDLQKFVPPFGYVGASNRGNHRLIDVEKVLNRSPDSASVAEPLEPLPEEESALFGGLTSSNKITLTVPHGPKN